MTSLPSFGGTVETAVMTLAEEKFDGFAIVLFIYIYKSNRGWALKFLKLPRGGMEKTFENQWNRVKARKHVYDLEYTGNERGFLLVKSDSPACFPHIGRRSLTQAQVKMLQMCIFRSY